MAGEYIDLGFPDDANPAVKLQAALDMLAAQVGYVPGPTDPLRVMLEQAAEMAADNESVTQTVARAITRWLGTYIFGVEYELAQPATANIVVTAKADTGGTIDAGVTEVSVDGESFIASETVTVAAGASESVGFLAATPGEDANGLFATPQPVTPLAWVDDWTLSVATSGGTEAETDEAYESKVVRKRRSEGRPILGIDFVEKAVDWPKVGRALVLDGYNADDATSGNDATETIAVVDVDGEPLTDPEMAALAAGIAAEREIGWQSFVIAPDYTTVDVAGGDLTVWPGFDATAALAAANAAVTAYLDPATFGASPGGERIDWNLEPAVLRSELTTVVNNVDGIRHMDPDTLLLNGVADDLALTGVAPLTRPGTIALSLA